MPVSVLDSNNHIVIVDEVSNTVTYVGYAEPGAATTDPVWQIKKILVSGTITSIKYANGEPTFSNEWDDRATLTYS